MSFVQIMDKNADYTTRTMPATATSSKANTNPKDSTVSRSGSMKFECKFDDVILDVLYRNHENPRFKTLYTRTKQQDRKFAGFSDWKIKMRGMIVEFYKEGFQPEDSGQYVCRDSKMANTTFSLQFREPPVTVTGCRTDNYTTTTTTSWTKGPNCELYSNNTAVVVFNMPALSVYTVMLTTTVMVIGIVSIVAVAVWVSTLWKCYKTRNPAKTQTASAKVSVLVFC